MVRCVTCRGSGRVNGMGGLLKDCKVCGGDGTLEKLSIAKDVEDKPKKLAVKEEAPKVTSKRVTFKKAPAVRSDAEPIVAATKPIVPPVIDEVTQACLEEPRMEASAWRQKYQHVPGLFGKSMITGQIEEAISKVQRAAIRASYAMTQPIAPRTVDLSAAQEKASLKDADYLSFKNNENARKAKEVAKK